MMVRWINQHRVWLGRLHWSVWICVSLYLCWILKVGHDDRMLFLHQQNELLKRVSLLKKNCSKVKLRADEVSLHAKEIELTWRKKAKENHILVQDIQVIPARFISEKALRVSVRLQSDFPSFLTWINQIKKEQYVSLLNHFSVSLGQSLQFSLEFILHSKNPSLIRKEDIALKKLFLPFDPFCLHAESVFPRAYRHQEDWKRYIDFSGMVFKSRYASKESRFGLFSWKGRLFWLEEGGALSGGARLQYVFRDHAKFILTNGRQITVS